MNLELTNELLSNKKYLNELDSLTELEHDRIFCRHNIEHFLDVARITLIMCHEAKITADPDIIYSAALLHDIGRTNEYINGIPHEKAGIIKAEAILDDINCEKEKKKKILSLIKNHKNDCENASNSLEDIFCRADKKSRLCFCCPAQNQCNWQKEKRNMDIEV